MKKVLFGIMMIGATLSYGSSTQDYLCGGDSDYPVVITVTDEGITNYKDQFNETECSNMASDAEIASQQQAIRNQLINPPSETVRAELEMYLEILLNKPMACKEKDPPSIASFNPATKMLTELNMKYQRFEQLKCIKH
ncbi:hypothetical protein HBN50_10180 [Halobacteriovorax sp. GB3]|uniref:hypothetical protein n=1 Tax=Halobacteriovorax sp. GB3 TaxID=2719615 RepID=UPI00235DE69E|nr:hypothetical protein [Halobacteriovorax sp. GB3]MDD0853468.1 hypothetical protein [Halobacteriovorax sp. GB3]